MLKHISSAILFGAFLISNICFGQQLEADTSKHLEEVIVVGATREKRVASTLPIVAKVISGKSIEKSGLSRLNEILQEQTGLIMVPTFNGGHGIQMQGMDSPYIMILVDNQPLIGRSSGTLDLSRITLQGIERIEIIKGASSCLYGSEALGGIINIITKTGEFHPHQSVDLSYKYARFNTHDAGTNLSFGNKKWNTNIGVNIYSSDGYSINPSLKTKTVEPFLNITINPKFSYKFNDKLTAKISSRLYRENQDYSANENIYKGKSHIKEWNPSLVVDQKISDALQFTYDLYASNYKADSYLNDENDKEVESTDFNQWLYRPEFKAKYAFNKHLLSTGIGYTYDGLKRTEFAKKEHLSQAFVYSQLEYYFTKKTNAVVGFRYDLHKQYESQFSPKVGVNIAVNDQINIKSSIGYGYKAPDLRQLFLDFTNSSVGYTVLGYNIAESRIKTLQEDGQILRLYDFNFNNPLKPESSINYNLAANYISTKFHADINLFYNKNTNLINTQIVAAKNNGQSIFSYFNVDKIRFFGVESNLNYRLLNNIKLSLGYQYLITEEPNVLKNFEGDGYFYKDANTLESKKLQRNEYLGLFNRSKHMVNAAFEYYVPKIDFTVLLRSFYRSRYGQGDTNANGIYDEYDQHIKGYSITDLTLGKRLFDKHLLQLGANNLFNFKNENISSFPGTQYFIRLQYTLLNK